MALIKLALTDFLIEPRGDATATDEGGHHLDVILIPGAFFTSDGLLSFRLRDISSGMVWTLCRAIYIYFFFLKASRSIGRLRG